MSNLFVENKTQYEFFDTADGSPSICLTSDKFRPEAMHHRGGALAESLFIYHSSLAQALDLGCAPRVLSVGLGCAYNELIAAAHFMKHNVPESYIYIESFEGETPLREGFLAWLSGAPSANDLEAQLFATFSRVLGLVAQHFSLDPTQLKEFVRTLNQQKKLNMREWLTTETKFDYKFGIIFFDAFSAQSTPEIWTEDFLSHFLQMTADAKCTLATYAATGALNRALRKNNFKLADQPGFSGKRQSTRALRIDAVGAL